VIISKIYILPVETQCLASKADESDIIVSKKRSKIVFERFFDT